MPLRIVLRRILLAASCLFCPLLTLAESPATAPVSYERDVRPILKAACFHCHGEGETVEASLDLRLARFIVRGGDSGPALEAGTRNDSLLYQRIRDAEMPPDPGHPLTAEQIDTIGRWIDAGAPTLRDEPESISDHYFTEEELSHWAWQPITHPSVPTVEHPELLSTPIDAFLLAGLETEGFAFSPPADRTTLLRRLYLDLIGLPPTPEEADRFLADETPGADSRLIDELLASPHYGERWGRHWLDVAGYADSEGYSVEDVVRDWAWKYRDYVIRAFNDDLPFDRFIREQLAGDELVTSPLDNLSPHDAELLAATGFLRMAPDGTAGNVDDAELARNEVVAETIKIVSSSLMGVTLGCAQCHDHRYDPIPQTDYYEFRAFFEPALDWKNWRNPKQRLISLYTDADRAKAAEIEAEAEKVVAERNTLQAEFIQATLDKEIAKLPEEIRDAAREAHATAAKDRTAEQEALFKQYPSLNVNSGSLYLYDRKAADKLKELADRAAEIRATKPAEEFVHALTEVPDQIPATHLFARGDFQQPKEELTPAFLAITSHDTGATVPANAKELATTGRRTALAQYLTSGQHPLVARVIVNRIWMHHFGRGLVSTPADFGALGTPPTHPDLLDWLASEFMDSGWSVKHLHRLILNSTAYRQALRTDPSQDAADPDNLLYGGARLIRLDAEVVRDCMLAASGRLNDQLYGQPVPVMADNSGRWVLGIENLSAGRPGAVIPLNGQEFRRSVYIQVRRSRPVAVLDTFDWPRMSPNCDCRKPSTVTPQSLMMMNSDAVIAESHAFAERVLSQSGDDAAQQVNTAWRLAYVRAPDDSERASAVQFLAEQTDLFRERLALPDFADDAKTHTPERMALDSLCQTLLGANGFLYVD